MGILEIERLRSGIEETDCVDTVTIPVPRDGITVHRSKFDDDIGWPFHQVVFEVVSVGSRFFSKVADTDRVDAITIPVSRKRVGATGP